MSEFQNRSPEHEADAEWLRSLGACSPSIGFLYQHEGIKEAWENCDRARWLVWFLVKTGTPYETVRDFLLKLWRNLLQVYRLEVFLNFSGASRASRIHEAALRAESYAGHSFAVEWCNRIRKEFPCPTRP